MLQNINYFLLITGFMILFLGFMPNIYKQGLKIRRTLIAMHFIIVLLIIFSFLILLVKEFRITIFLYPGIVVFLLGILIMASALLEIKIQAFIPGEKLITTGIYSYIRHPIYLGGILSGFGLSLFAGSMLALIYVLIMTFMLVCVLKEEEKELVKRFGNKYKSYLKKVPAFIPRLKK